MKTIIKRMVCSFLVLFMAITMMPQNINTAKAATTGMVYKYSTMTEENGSIYYIQSIEGDTIAYYIYRLEVSTGTKTKIASSDNNILTMAVYNNILYYTSYETGNKEYSSYSVSIDGGDNQKVCNGSVVYADGNGIYYTVSEETKCKLYKKTYKDSKDTLVYTGNSTFAFIKNLDSTLYFGQYADTSYKITLFSMESDKSKLTTLATSKVEHDSYSSSIPNISDVAKVNGDIYYQYGTHEGSGSFWYGTLVKVDSDTNKKTTISKNMIESTIFYNATKIFYNDMKNDAQHYTYDTKSGKTTTYKCEVGNIESFNILGSKTYSAKPVSNKYITVASFTSGTNKKNLTKDFIKFSYKQKSSLTYTAGVNQLGDYLLVSVECTDYNDATYGWRGNYIGIKWYVTDLNGKVLADFS